MSMRLSGMFVVFGRWAFAPDFCWLLVACNEIGNMSKVVSHLGQPSSWAYRSRLICKSLMVIAGRVVDSFAIFDCQLFRSL